MESIWYYETAVGTIGIQENGTGITHLFLGKQPLQNDVIQKETPLIKQAGIQLQEYIKGERRQFDLPLVPAGTPFQKRVWDALCKIPFGETRSYKEIAQEAGSPKGFRAVGMANHKNPIPILIPCHRVIGSDGSLTGYAYGLAVKTNLLAIETPVL